MTHLLNFNIYSDLTPWLVESMKTGAKYTKGEVKQGDQPLLGPS